MVLDVVLVLESQENRQINRHCLTENINRSAHIATYGCNNLVWCDAARRTNEMASFWFHHAILAGFETDGLLNWKTSVLNGNRTFDNKAFSVYEEDIRVKTTNIPRRDATRIYCGSSILVECVMILMFCNMNGPCLYPIIFLAQGS